LSDEIIGQVRRISAQLRPAVLDDLGLAAALSWKVQEVEKRCGILFKVAIDLAEGQVARDVATAVFRVFEEALTNVLRHAEAQHVEVRLAEKKGWLVLEVIDDGKGIRQNDIIDPRSLGLMGMRERARHLGGCVTLSRHEDGGTIMTLRLPTAG
jgi:signal transduction histidine kinase